MKIVVIIVILIIILFILKRYELLLMMIFFPKSFQHYWLGVGWGYIKEMKPKEAIAALANVIAFAEEHEDTKDKGSYIMAVYGSGMAYVALRGFELARNCLNLIISLNHPNKQLIDELNAAIEKTESSWVNMRLL